MQTAIHQDLEAADLDEHRVRANTAVPIQVNELHVRGGARGTGCHPASRKISRLRSERLSRAARASRTPEEKRESSGQIHPPRESSRALERPLQSRGNYCRKSVLLEGFAVFL